MLTDMSKFKTPDTGTVTEYLTDLFPNSKDNLIQIIIKLSFLLASLAILTSGIFFTGHYYSDFKELSVSLADREIFENYGIEEANQRLHSRNYDYRAWLNLGETSLNNPVFKSTDNRFYLSHNSLKNKNINGSLFLDCKCSLTDNNIIIYGNSPENGGLFSTLHSLRQLSFYREHSLLTLTDSKTNRNYKIYAVFVLNSSRNQDDGRIYNIHRQDFSNDSTFDSWVDEAKKRSIINTGVSVKSSDKILTLVTSCEDFEDARLIVMARLETNGEELSNINASATANPSPKYPKKWYEDRNIKYPF